jgi:hypothetical protein
MNFIQRPRGGRPGHEFPDAITERTVDNQIRSSVVNPTFVVERRPFAKDSRRAEIDIRVVTAVHLDFAFSPSSREPNVVGFRLAIASAGDFEREPVANPILFGIYSCGLKIIDVQKHIRTAGVDCDKSEATVCLPHFKFSSAHLFPLRLQLQPDLKKTYAAQMKAKAAHIAAIALMPEIHRNTAMKVS